VYLQRPSVPTIASVPGTSGSANCSAPNSLANPREGQATAQSRDTPQRDLLPDTTYQPNRADRPSTVPSRFAGDQRYGRRHGVRRRPAASPLRLPGQLALALASYAPRTQHCGLQRSRRTELSKVRKNRRCCFARRAVADFCAGNEPPERARYVTYLFAGPRPPAFSLSASTSHEPRHLLTIAPRSNPRLRPP
jgi:hypothetical protein